MTTGSLQIEIDLSTTTSCVAVYRNGKVIQNDISQYLTPSFVSYAKGKELIGEETKEKLIKYPECAFYDVKKLIGRRYKDKSLQDYIKLL